MKTPTFAFLFVVLATLVLAISDETKCTRKNYDVWRTIGGFCRKMDMVVPSDYASTGNAVLEKGIVVMIGGKCSPPQWVPRKYCLSQFHKICAEGSLTGAGQGKYGKNKCQNWVINTAPAMAGAIL